jgi:hypothetical protein
LRKKRKQIVIESDSDSEAEIVEQKPKRVCVIHDDDSDDDCQPGADSSMLSSFIEENTESFEESPSCKVEVSSFLETGTLQDFISVPGLSQVKAEKIISLKPFKDEHDIVSFLKLVLSFGAIMKMLNPFLFIYRRLILI